MAKNAIMVQLKKKIDISVARQIIRNQEYFDLKIHQSQDVEGFSVPKALVGRERNAKGKSNQKKNILKMLCLL